MSEVKIDSTAMFNLSYGLFVLTAKQNERDNGCIINTVMQITDNPKRIAIGINKQNYTHNMIQNTGKFNISILTESVPFEVFKHFGFQSGHNVDKTSNYSGLKRSENKITYLENYTNTVLSGKVIQQTDCGTHTLFVAEVTEAIKLSAEKSVTYSYYFDHIKPAPQKPQSNVKGYVCKICGYVYEGDPLPSDFICPICKHGAEDFEPIN